MRWDKWDGNEEYFIPVQEQASDLTLGIVGLDRKVSNTLESLLDNLSEFHENPSKLVNAAEDFSKFCALGILDLGVRAVLYAVYWPIPSVYQNFINLARMSQDK
ncbi:hypothetical protein COT07_00335 [Candidatus Woesearchaeota archaeon CG07_land_8_20_14_0_80_44_23]|nr:MAG: hypothetical protein COT07_00335 [Candidatus Woesearchaeota archaeon CG07_land_8_20_14_0_80_44_23]